MSKLILIWCILLGLMLFTVLSYAQVIVLDPDGNVKSIVIMPLPPPTR